MEEPARFCSDEDLRRSIPVHVVWELTLACNLKCIHCGSRAGRRRPKELSTAECLEVVEALARLGTREVSLIGGEAYLRSDWIEVIRAIRANGMYCAVQTGGRSLNQQRLERAVEAGLNGLGVSLDGLEALHDRLRGVKGSFRNALEALRCAKRAGLQVSVNTQVGASTMDDLPGLMDAIIDVGASHWQIQLTVPAGNAADHDDLILQPYRLIELMPLLARLYLEGLDRNLLLIMGNNVGYFGPYEYLWRGLGDERIHWSGCKAGRTVLALEADGTVKGCPSLPPADYAGANVRNLSLERIWQTNQRIAFAREGLADGLSGFCQTCYYAEVCGGGCTWMAHSLLGHRGNNPYCHFRALELQKRGLRERIIKLADALPVPFANAHFAIVQEDSSGSVIANYLPKVDAAWLDKLPYRSVAIETPVSPKLEICRACDCYVWPDETRCPHCGSQVQEAADQFSREARARQAAKEEIGRVLAMYGLVSRL
jgi:Y-X(10)_GDL-associated radical SAM protein